MIRTKHCFAIAAITLLLFAAGSAHGQLLSGPWPKYRAVATNTGLAASSGPASALHGWSYATGAAIHGSPSITATNQIVFVSQDEYLYCVGHDGTLAWRYDIRSDTPSSPAVSSSGVIYVGSDDNYLYALNANGTLRWRKQLGDDIEASPTIGSDGRIYVGSLNGRLYALDTYGTIKWSYPTGSAVVSSPATMSSVLYFGSNDGYLYSLNTSGSLRWRYNVGAQVQSSPAVDSVGIIYVANTSGRVCAINSNGSLRWQYNIGSAVTSSPAICPDGSICVGADDNYVYAFNADGSLKWRYLTGGQVRSSPAVGTTGIIYVGSLDGSLYAIKPDGTLQWSHAVGSPLRSSPAINSDGTLYIGADDGTLHSFLPDATPPTTPVVIDDGQYSTSGTSLHASWSSTDPESGISRYDYAIGTSPTDTSVVDWTNAGIVTEVTRMGLALTDGVTYYFLVKARNGAQGWSEIGASDGIFVDASPPTTPVVQDGQEWVSFVDTLSASWTAADPHSGVAEYEYCIGTSPGGFNVEPWTSVGLQTSVVRTGLALQHGSTYYTSVRARNGAGSWSSVGVADGVSVDHTPPSVPVVTDDGAYTSSLDSLHASWTATDAESGVAEYSYAIGTSPGATDVADWTSTGTSTQVTRGDLSLTNGASYYFSVKARNRSGLWSGAGASDGIVVDGTAPDAPVVVDDGAYTSGVTSLHASWTASDAESGVVAYQYAIGTTPGATNTVNWTSVGSATEVTKTGLSLISGTTYYVSVKAQNGSGIWSNAGTSDGITVDTSVASTPVVVDDGGYTSSASTLHAVWSSSDAQSGIAEYQYAIGTTVGGSNIVAWTSAGAATEVTRTGLTLPDGTAYFFSVKARNGANLWSSVGSSDGIVVDASPPAVPVVTDDGVYTSSATTLHASWSSSDPHSGIGEYQYAIGTSPGETNVVNWTSAGTATQATRSDLSLTSGFTYYFTVRARNQAGLWSGAGVSDGITADSTAPNAPVVIDDGLYTSSLNSLHATWSASDPESGVVAYQYAIGTTPGGTNTVNWTSVGSATEVTRTGLFLINGNTYYISVKAQNGSGLWSSVGTSDGITIDSTAASTPVVIDDGAYSSSADTLHATWSSSDTQSGIAEYQYAIGTSAGGTNVVSWTSVGAAAEMTRGGLSLTDGTTYYISVKARNGANLWSSVGYSDGIMVDTSPPTLPVVTDDGAYTSSSTTLHASWTSSDTHSGIGEYEYAIGTSPGATDIASWTSTGTLTQVTRNDLSLTNGSTYYFSVRARNRSGLWSSVGVSDGITVDSTAPASPVVVDDGAYTSSVNSIQASWSASDAESGVVAYQYAIGTTPGGTNTVNWTSVGSATEVTRSVFLTNGTTYYFSVKAQNGSGLWSNVGLSDGITVDSTAASTPVVIDDGAFSVSSDTLHATWSSSDAQSGIAEYQYAIGTTAGGSNVVGWTSVGTATEITRDGLTLADGSTYYISVKARNGASLWSNVGSSDGIMVDTSPPSVPVVTDGGAYTSSATTLHASWTSSDPHSGIAEYQYAIGTSPGGTNVVGWTSTATTTQVTRGDLSLTNGVTYYFSVRSRNQSGLWSATGVSDGITADSTPPTAPSVVDDGAYTWSLNTLHASWSASDAESGVAAYQYAIGTTPGGTNTLNWTSIGSATEVTRSGLSLINGYTYYISVKAQNGSGLWSSVGTSDGITVDSTGASTPVVVDDGAYSLSADSLHATWSSSDAQSGIAEYQYAIGTTVGGANVVNWTSVGTATEVTQTGLSLNDGVTYYISVKARNGANLWSNVGSSDGIMVDASAPSVPVVTDDGAYTSSSTTLHAAWASSDPHSGIADYEYAIGTVPGATDVVNWTSVGTATQVTRNDLSLTNGASYYFSVRARNRSGLWSGVGVSDGIVVDSTAPDAPTVIDDGAYTSTLTSLHAGWSASDAESGVVAYQYAIGTTPGAVNVVNWTPIGSATEVTRTGLSLLNGTTYYFSVKAQNGSGLWSIAGTSDGIIVDSTAASTPVVIDDGVYSASADSLHATWSSSDAQSGIAEYQYAIGTAAGGTNVVNWNSVGTATEMTRNGLSLLDGTTYYISVKARNGANLWSNVGSSDGIMVDASAPAVPVVTDDGAYTSSSTTLHASWTGSDPHSGVGEYEYAIGTAPGATDIVNWTSAGTATQVTRSDLSLTNGASYYFSVRARNRSGLWSGVGVSDGIVVDSTAPGAPTVIDDGAYTSNLTSLHASWSAVDAESGVVAYQYAIGTTPGGTNTVNWTSVGSATEVTRTGLSLAGGSTYYFSVKAQNGSGLWSVAGTSDGIVVDSTAASTPVVIDDGIYSSSAGSLHATWSSSDAQSGIAEYQYAIGTSAGGTNVVNWTSAGTATEVTRTGLSLSDGTTYFISVKARNGANLWSNVGSSDGIIVDASAPVVPVVTDDGAYTSSSTTLHASWSSSDPHTGVAEYQYAIGTSAGGTDVVNWTSSGILTQVTRTGLSLANGTSYYFSVKARNQAGLWSVVGASDGITVDSTPPAAPVVLDDGAYTSSLASLHASWSASDVESGVVAYQYAIGTTPGAVNIVNWTPVGSAAEVTRSGLALINGNTYYFSVKAQNGSGLWSGVGTSDGITVDSTPASTPVVIDDGAFSASPNTLHATWSSSDAQSGIAEYQYAIGTTAGGTNVADWTSAGTATEVTRNGLLLTDGTTYYISVKARNGSSLWSNVGSSDGILVDASPPTVPVVTDDGAYTASSTTLHASWTSDDPHTGVVEYQYAIGTSPGGTNVVNWVSVGTTTQVTRSDLTLTGGTSYYFSVKARNGIGVWSVPGISDGIRMDQTPPGAPTITDDGETTASFTALRAWWNAVDAESGIGEYEYAIGTIPGATDVVGWTSAGDATYITHAGLSLSLDNSYFFAVRAKNGVGLWGPIGVSDGIRVTISTAWPRFRANESGTGASVFTGPASDALARWYYTGAGISSSAAIGGDNTSYIGCDDGALYAIGANGYLHWYYQTGGPIDSSPAIGKNGCLVFGSYDHYIYCLNSEGGLRWRYAARGVVRSSPVIAGDDCIYIGSEDGYIYALNWNGTRKWEYRVGSPVWSSPTLRNGVLYFGAGDGGIYALSTAGSLVWRFPTGTAVDSSPCIDADGTVYAGSGDGWFYAINPNGTQKWRYYVGTMVDSSAAIGPDGTIYFGSGDDWSSGGIYALRPNGTLKWEFDTGSSVRTSPAVDSTGNVYVGTSDGSLYSIDSNGGLRWSYVTEGALYSSPAIGRDGSIVIGTAFGYLLTFADSGNDPTGPTTPVVVDEGAATVDLATLRATWSSSDPQSGVAEYAYAVGTHAGTDDVATWTSTGLLNAMTRSGLNLSPGVVYYVSVKARNGAGKWSSVGVSDGIVAISPPWQTTIGQAKTRQLGSTVYLEGKVVTAAFGDWFYIEEPDRSAAIRVAHPGLAASNVGRTASVCGTLGIVQSELAIVPVTIDLGDQEHSVAPVGMPGRSLGGVEYRADVPAVDGGFGLDTIGLLVTVWGRVTYPGSDYFFLDDGSVTDFLGVPGVMVVTPSALLGAVTEGDMVRVVGIASIEPEGLAHRRLIRVRDNSEITPLD